MLLLLDLMLVRLVQPREIWDDVVLKDGVRDEQVKHMDVAIVSFGIKRTSIKGIRKIGHCIIPLLVVNQVMVQNRGVPITVAGKDDMRQSIPFGIGVGPHFDVWETALDVQGNDISIQCLDVLLATDFHGLVIDMLLVPFELTGRMNGFSLASVSILVQNDDDFTALCFHYCSSSYNRDVHNLVVVNSLHIDLTACPVDDTNIVTSNSTIGTSINECSCTKVSMAGGRVLDVLVGCIVGDTILYNGLASWGCRTFGHGEREDPLDVAGWDIFLPRHVGKQGRRRGVRFRRNFDGGASIAFHRFTNCHLVELNQVFQGTDVM